MTFTTGLRKTNIMPGWGEYTEEIANQKLKQAWNKKIDPEIKALSSNAVKAIKAEATYHEKKTKLEEALSKAKDTLEASKERVKLAENKLTKLDDNLAALHNAAQEAYDKLIESFNEAKAIRAAQNFTVKNAKNLDELEKAYYDNKAAYAILYKNGNIIFEKGTWHIVSNHLSDTALEFYKEHGGKGFKADEVGALENANFEHEHVKDNSDDGSEDDSEDDFEYNTDDDSDKDDVSELGEMLRKLHTKPNYSYEFKDYPSMGVPEGSRKRARVA